MDAPATSLRMALVTPYAWGPPHAVNDHVLELATGIELELAAAPGPRAVVIAPSLRPKALRSTRRALRELARGGDPADVLAHPDLHCVGSDGSTPICVLAVGLPVTLGRASVAMRAGLRTIFEHAGIEILHVHDPVEPLSRTALRRWPGLAIATIHELPSEGALESMPHPVRRRALEQIDIALVPDISMVEATGALLDREPGSIKLTQTMTRAILDPHAQRASIVLGRGELDDADAPRVVRTLRSLLDARPTLNVVLLSRWRQHHRPSIPRALRGRVTVLTPRTRRETDAVLSTCAVYVALSTTPLRAILEARAAGAPVILADDDILDHAARALDGPALQLPELPDERSIASSTIDIAESLLAKRRTVTPQPRLPATRSCMIDLHMHTDHSWDCAIDPEALLWTAREVGLTAIAVTDHNEVSGALVCAELADEYGLQVIVGEEVMTAEGEVIGLFLNERVEPGLSWHETLRRIRAQDALVYVPHPFDRLHTIPDPSTLRATVDEIDAFEIYNSRLAFEQYNRDAARFARKYNLAEGAGSDAHVVQGLGTAAVHMPAWDGPASFLAALRQGEIVRRPKSYVYLQGLKFLQTRAKKRQDSPAPKGNNIRA